MYEYGGVRTVCVDLPGHGARFEEDLDVEQCILVLRRVIDDLKMSRVPVVVGDGFGALVAVAFAARHPERCGGLVLVNAGKHLAPSLIQRLWNRYTSWTFTPFS